MEPVGARHEMLRLCLALYLMLTAIGLFNYPALDHMANVLFGGSPGSEALRLLFFAASWLLLVGLWMRAMVSLLILFIAAARLVCGLTTVHTLLPNALIHDAALIFALVLVGGLHLSAPRRSSEPKPARLVRRTPPAPRKVALATGAVSGVEVFDSSPDDLARLFDQIGEA